MMMTIPNKFPATNKIVLRLTGSLLIFFLISVNRSSNFISFRYSLEDTSTRSIASMTASICLFKDLFSSLMKNFRTAFLSVVPIIGNVSCAIYTFDRTLKATELFCSNSPGSPSSSNEKSFPPF